MASLSPAAKQAFLNNSGQPAAGYQLYTYQTGTSTPLVTYSDSAATVPNANPITLDARGEAIMYLGTQAYRYVLKDALGSVVWTRDNVVAPAERAELLSVFSDSTGASKVGYLQGASGSIARTVQDRLRDTVNVFDFFTTAQIASVRAGDLA
jgi:hypothetical protein